MEKKQKTKKEKDTSPKTSSEKTTVKQTKKDFLVVGLGASAGGVRALQEFFATMPPNSGMAFVAILHLSPEHESNLPAIIQAQTEMKVTQVTKTVKVEPNNVYVIPPNQQLEMVDGVIRPTKAERPTGHRIAIDVFFRTLAEAYEKNAVCVVLSGTGSDGTLGLKRVKESNGFAVVQDPEDAEYDSMPRSAINTQLADWVLPVHQMPEKLIHFRESSERLHLTNGADAKKVGEEIHADESLREILTLLRVRTGHDFSNYKTPTLIRRIARHLQIHELEDIPSYLELLRNNPDEIQSLLKNLLINVTNFFRDKSAFAALEADIIPNLFAGKTGKDTVRVWSCGCASGEEAYSLAMILSEYADTLADPPKFQVFASDVDDEAIAEAREHRYPESIEADVSQDRLKRFFVKEGSFYRVKKELREAVLFAPHNVLRDPPFSRLDMITCRNLLIYLNRETQERVLQIFHFALQSHGYLFLGSSETAENVATLYAPVDKKNRIYSRRNAPLAQNTMPMMPVVGRWEVRIPEPKTKVRDRAATLSEIHYKLLENYAPSSILVNQDFDIVYLSGAAGKFLRFSDGEPSRNLLKAVNPDLLPDLRAALFSAQREHKSSEFPNIRVDIDGEERIINLIVRAVDVKDEASDFLLVIFEERNSPSILKQAEREVEKIINKDEAMETVVRRLEEDLQRTKEHLRFTIEQHETTVEELKASNEELQAINEELRSASEELETSKEELQSVNEELTTVNHELKDKIDETGRVNSDLSNLMAATDIATIFLDKQLKIKRYTPPVQEIFNITMSDVGRPLEHFTHKLRYENLAADAEKVLRTLAPVEHEIKDGKNRSYLSRFAPYRTLDDRIDGVVLNFIDITERKKAEIALRESEEQLSLFVSATSDVIYEMNADWSVMSFLKGKDFIATTDAPRDDWMEAYIPETEKTRLRAAINKAIKSRGTFELEHRILRLDGSTGWTFSRAVPLVDEFGKLVKWFGTASDTTEQKHAEQALSESEEKYRTLFNSIDEGFCVIEIVYDETGVGADYRFIEVNPVFEQQTGLKNVTGKLASRVAPKTENYWTESYERVARTGETLRIENYHEATKRWYHVYASSISGTNNRVAVVFNDITERKLREREQEYLLKLNDALRPLSNPVAIQETAMRILGEHLKVSRAFYGEVYGDEDTILFYPSYADGVNPLAGETKFADFDIDMMNSYRAGQTVVLDDIQADEAFSAKAKAEFAAIEVAAACGVPLLKDGKVRAILSIHQSAPRTWMKAEITLLEETAERTWAAVERAKVEEALRESESRLQSIANLVPDLLWDSEPDGSTNWHNERWLEYTGQSFEEAIGWGWADAIHPDDREASVRRYREAGENGEMLRQEHRIRRYDGEYRWFVVNAFPLRDESGQVVKVYGSATDIHESRLMNEALSESEKLFRLVSDAVPSVIYDWNVQEDKIRRSDELVNLLGYSPDEPQTQTNKWWKTLLHPEDAKRAVGKVVEKLKSNDYHFEDEYRLQHRDGHYVWISDTGVLLRDESGKVVRWVGSVTNVSQRREYDERLRESEEKYRALFDSIDAGFCVIEVLFNKKERPFDYRFLETNPAFVKQTGLENATGKTIGNFTKEHEQFWFDTYGEIVKTGKPARFEHQAEALGKWYEVYAFRIGAPEENQVAVLFRDVAERRKAQEALRVSEERLRVMFNQATAGVGQTDPQGKFTFVNDAYCNITGYSREELLGLTLQDITLPEDFAANAHLLKNLIEKGESFIIEKRYVRKDGSLVWVQNSVSAMYGANDEISALLAVSVDIDERKQVSEALNESEKRLRIAVEAAEMGTWDWDLVKNEVRWNDRHFILLGMDPRKNPIPAAEFFEHVHPQDRERVKKSLDKAIKNKTAFEAEFCIIRDDGQTRWMEGYGHIVEMVKGKPARMSGVMSDVTVRKTAAEALRKSEEQLQLILESTKDYSIITFDLEGTITRWNTGAEKIFGYTEKEMVGIKGDILFTPEDRRAGVPAQEFETALEKGRAEDERWHLRKDGSRFFASGVMQPLKDGELEGFVKIARDQTERLEAETALREQELLRQFVRTQEDERRRIARDMHDELGQQLTALRMKLDTVRKAHAEPVLLNQLNEIRDIARNIDEGVDFLAFELRPSVLNDFGLVAALDNYIQQWSHYSNVKGDLVVSNLKKTRFKQEVETCLYRIVQESLNNVHKHAKATNVEVVCEIRRDQLILIVEDNGKGFNLKSKFNKNGIGLIGMQERVSLIGGTLEIETAPKKGTTVYVRIPLSVAKA